jgi:hypothetical protein
MVSVSMERPSQDRAAGGTGFGPIEAAQWSVVDRT